MTDKANIILSALFMTLGVLVYVCFCQPVMFTAILAESMPIVGLPDCIAAMLFRNYVPDALWCVSLLTYASTISAKQLRAVAVSMPFLHEWAQASPLMPGTFDVIDLALYTTITIIFLLLWKRKSQNLRRSFPM